MVKKLRGGREVIGALTEGGPSGPSLEAPEFVSGLDALFLHLETPETPMHVGSLHRFELPERFRGDLLALVKTQIRAHLNDTRVFTRKLAPMPLGVTNPAWVIDDAVDLDYHIRRMRLPPPGGQAQLEALAGRLHSTLLDRSRPLWEMVVIEGLAEGGFGFYAKVHHAGLDGMAAVALVQALYDTTPARRPSRRSAASSRAPAPPAGASAAPAETPDRRALLKASLRANASQLITLGRDLPGIIKSLVSAVAPSRDAEGHWHLPTAGGNKLLAPRTLLNHSIGGARAFGTASLPVDQVKAIARHHHATVNDVVLALCGGALRRYLRARRALPDAPMLAAVPVSLRASGDGQSNTQAMMARMSMGTHLADPVERLLFVRDDSARIKSMLADVKRAVPTDFPSLGIPWIASALAGFYGRAHLADALPPLANVIVSNVPGPPVPLYMQGARMRSYWPLSIAYHGYALNVTVESYAGSLDFGFTACRRTLPGVARLAGMLVEEFEILHGREQQE